MRRAVVCIPWVLVLLAALKAFVSAQTPGAGFINIDCGAAISEPAYKNPDTGLLYSNDTAFISTGQSASVATTSAVTRDLRTLRYFPAGSTPTKNCLVVPVQNATVYLIRLWFYFGNYAPLPASGQINFQLAIDASVLTNVSIDGTQDFFYNVEAMVAAKRPSVSVCLIRTQDASTPFISSLEMRPQSSGSYVTGQYDRILRMVTRDNFGETKTIRYPDDQYDRLWNPLLPDAAATSIRSIVAPGYPDRAINNAFAADNPPGIVMQTALTGSTINYTVSGTGGIQRVYAFLYFAEINGTLAPGTARIVDMAPNFGAPAGSAFYAINVSSDLRSAFSTIVFGTADFSIKLDTLVFYMTRDAASDYDPLVNAFELYQVLPVAPDTNPDDVAALFRLRSEAGLLGEWTGDACSPIPWDALGCTNYRVTSLNFSGRGLHGLIPSAIAGLKALSVLDLSNNHLTGPLPTWVGDLTSLDILDVSNNNLNGTFPATYITSISPPGGSTGFRYSGNSDLTCVPQGNQMCDATGKPGLSPSPDTKSSSSVGPIVGGVVGGVLIILLLAALLLWFCCCTGGNTKDPSSPGSEDALSFATAGNYRPSTIQMPQAMRGQAQPYTLAAIKEATNNYARKLGEGGFGPVYYGIFQKDNLEVAVKVMSGKTQQGLSEFTNEIELLSTVHFKKLVSLVGYCQEGQELLLLYEYMAGGDLRTRLYGSPLSQQFPLNWRQRLELALDAAKGLEYLHNGCNPSIIHRDVKTSNILLSSKLEAKMADFGLSKITNEDQSHVMTMVKGTLGYLDPDYNVSGILTDKSDVYSFGVVLLEILCGQPPVLREAAGPKFIVDRMRAAMNTGSLETMVDPSLGGEYSLEAAWRLAEIAMSCVPMTTASRPGMNKVVSQLAQLLEMESGASNAAFSSPTASEYEPDLPSQMFYASHRPIAK